MVKGSGKGKEEHACKIVKWKEIKINKSILISEKKTHSL